ncbi:MAG: sugar ABC transporter permease [Eubacteriales bacterium]|nr:sugar ABC transporter permease [Eubacteriales bacterium]MDD3880862.1 sugar ABC transporter permease [Eubacteriales bacterium]MDD4511771.1 sugar ABC transporter permease [Eubacteriales bacterium]
MAKTRVKAVSYAKYGYLFSLPFIVAYLIFSLYPTLYTAVIGFTDLKGVARNFKFLAEPFKNFSIILNNVTFQNSLVNTFEIWIMNFIPQIALSLLLTAWFTSRARRIRCQGAFKVLFYLPNIITSATVAILFATMFGYPIGPINDILVSTGMIEAPFNFLTSPIAAKLVVAFIQFWKWYGYTTIVLISGALGINPELFESAEIDGARPSQIFFRITLPCMRTILVFTLITSLIGGLNMFDIPKLYIMDGGPADATKTASVFIYTQAFKGAYLYNRAAAASMIMFVIIAICSAVVFFIMRDKHEVQQKRDERRAKRIHSKRLEGLAE